MAALGLRCCPRAFSSCGAWASHCSGFSSAAQAPAAAAPGLSGCAQTLEGGLRCYEACRIFPDQGWNWAPLHCKVKVTQSRLILCDPMDYTVHGILQARILEWVAFPFCRGSSQPKDRTQVSLIAGGFFTSWATREAQEYWSGYPIPSPADLPNPGIEPGSPALQVDFFFLPTTLSWKPLHCKVDS